MTTPQPAPSEPFTKAMLAIGTGTPRTNSLRQKLEDSMSAETNDALEHAEQLETELRELQNTDKQVAINGARKRYEIAERELTAATARVEVLEKELSSEKSYRGAVEAYRDKANIELHESHARETQLREALERFAAVADAYSNNGLDEARPDWEHGLESDSKTELLSGRGGRELLLLRDFLDAKQALALPPPPCIPLEDVKILIAALQRWSEATSEESKAQALNALNFFKEKYPNSFTSPPIST